MASDPRKKVHILLVEDNEGEAELVRTALKEVRTVSGLNVVTNGIEAMKYLRMQPPYERAERPDIVLLDLNLPRKNGRETLEEIKSDLELKAIPVVIFTSSNKEEDILRSYYANANCYVIKPADFHEFRLVVKAIADFWFTVAALPPKEDPQ